MFFPGVFLLNVEASYKLIKFQRFIQSYRKLNQSFPRHHRCFAYVCHKLKLEDFTHTIFTLSLRWQGKPLNRLTPGGRYKTEIAKAEEKKLVNCATVYIFCQIITRGTERKKKQNTTGNKNKHTGSSFEQTDLQDIKIKLPLPYKNLFLFSKRNGFSHFRTLNAKLENAAC